MRGVTDRQPPTGDLDEQIRDKRLRKRFTGWDWRQNWGAYLAAGILFVFAGYCLFVRGDIVAAMGFSVLGLVAATWRSAREILAEIPGIGAVFRASKGKDIATEKVTTPPLPSGEDPPSDDGSGPQEVSTQADVDGAPAPSERPRSSQPPPQ